MGDLTGRMLAQISIKRGKKIKKVEVKNVQQIRNHPDHAPAQYATSRLQRLDQHTRQKRQLFNTGIKRFSRLLINNLEGVQHDTTNYMGFQRHRNVLSEE